MWDGNFGQIKVVEHRIELISSEKQPIHLVPYQASPHAREVGEHEISMMVVMGVVEPAQSGWEKQILFVDKKIGTLQICEGKRKFNVVTMQDSYSIPGIDEFINCLGNAALFSTGR